MRVASIIALVLALAAPTLWGDAPRIAFLAAEPTLDDMGPHNHAAWDLAQTLGEATLLHANEAGFVDSAGTVHDLTGFDVAWYHQGDAIERTSLYNGPRLDAMRAHAARGGGVLLSGGSLAMVFHLGLEAEIRAQRRTLEKYRDPAALVRVKRGHPVFAGLDEQDGLIWLSRGGCPAVADFYWGGPGGGMVLGNTPQGVQKPLVEYQLGEGRVIVFGGLWPDYADAESPHRPNLTRLTANLIEYLSNATSWQPVVIPSAYPPVAYETPGIAPERWRALRLAIEDLTNTYSDTYPNGAAWLAELETLKAEHDAIPADSGGFAPVVARFEALQREALLANPLLDFDELLLIRRKAGNLGLPLNFNGNADLPPTGYGNTLLAYAMATGETNPVFEPPGDRFIGDLDLHYDGRKALISMPNKNGRWGVWELELASGALTPVPLIDEPDVHNYDACYLPDERIVFTSTAPFHGVPCVGGRSKVANLYLRDRDGAIRRLTNDQDHNWCPAVLNNGRILYQRWEYTDIAHAFTRILFHANPDGTRQMEYYGSNSFWPTAMFYARPVPGHPTKVVAVVGGHHDAPRQGELVVFDPALGRQEADGAVQRIPGYGKPVEPVILDGLINASWPRFLHPFPLNEHYFIVSCKPTRDALWGVYLVDTFDNFVLLHEEPGWAMLEPTPRRATKRPPVLPDSVNPDRKTGVVQLMDVYRGPGLAGVPRGSVKALRVISYNFTFHDFGGEPDRVGLDGPWDVKKVLGTVPVEADGSAHFTVPAHTPVAVQPLDEHGQALALMRSWFTAMPGELLSCVGCHESQNSTPPADSVPLAVRREPSAIEPWYGPARGFSFEREVQPVLDAYCVQCHNGSAEANALGAADLTARPAERVPSAFQMHFSPAYMELRRWINGQTLESDAHLLPPRAFHAETSKLVQILRDGHYGVELSKEAWDRLITWIDLHAPYHGTWAEVVAYDPTKLAAAKRGAERRQELHRRYAGIDEDPEAVYPAAEIDGPAQPPALPENLVIGALFGEAAAPTLSDTASPETDLRVELGEGVPLEFVRIERGAFVMGSADGYPNERPPRSQAIDQPFYMARFEVTNRQYRCFDPTHDSGLETGEAYQFGDDERGFPLNRPDQPVVRVSWEQATAFCEWLSAKTGRTFSLPSEWQWEYACRAGTTTPMWYGTLDTNFSGVANLSDATHHTVYYPHVPTALPPWRPADTRFNDGWRVSAHVGSFTSNPWGLHDMHGNVAEWTASQYDRYGEPQPRGRRKVVRGGSWLDRPRRARSAFRLHYDASQAVHDVGFRVICTPDPSDNEQLAARSAGAGSQ